MNDELPEYDPTSQHAQGPEATAEQVSNLKLVIGILVMLIPAGVPLYFAFGADGTAVIVLVAAATAVAIMNTLLVYGIWSWINSSQSAS